MFNCRHIIPKMFAPVLKLFLAFIRPKHFDQKLISTILFRSKLAERIYFGATLPMNASTFWLQLYFKMSLSRLHRRFLSKFMLTTSEIILVKFENVLCHFSTFQIRSLFNTCGRVTQTNYVVLCYIKIFL